ncbi:MAG: cytosolic protein [Desulfobacteraceae bacterium]|nr:cytosolic protein [Desulfobacteraceae bacterium]
MQAQKKTDFPHRTFIYNYRSYDLYQRPVASLAVLADDNPNWRPSVYSHKIWGCRISLRFRTVKLLDYRKQLKSLENSNNIFAIATAAHLRTMETKKNVQTRFRYKVEPTKNLYRQGFSKTDIINLYRFIDWIMVLPKESEDAYHREIIKFEEKHKMKYITTAERIGMHHEGTKILLSMMKARFGAIPQWAKEKVEKADITAIENWSIRLLSANSPEEVLNGER